MPIDDKVLNIVNALTRLTEQETLSWDTTPDEETFRVSVPRGVVRVAKIAPFQAGSDSAAPGEESFIITILDESGRVIEEHRALGSRDVEALSVLHTLARRSALKTDDFLNSILQDLDRRVRK